MRARLGKDWVEGLADPHRREHEVRIQVRGLLNLEAIEGLYPTKPRNARLVWNYLREIGPTATARKVLSRTSERHRNAKFVSCGFGRVVECPGSGKLRTGESVVFLSPAGPACTDGVVVPEGLVVAAESGAVPELAKNTLLHLALQPSDGAAWWVGVRGWHAEAGLNLPSAALEILMKEAGRAVREADWKKAQSFAAPETAPATVLPAPRVDRIDGRPRAALFGYGNYAKTVALPALRNHLTVDRIHEIDPTQIPLRRPAGVTWDSSPHLSEQTHDAVIVAGYHHTHAPVAAEALRRGAAVLIEKPIATTRPQLRELLAAMREGNGSVFSGYQRRYLPFNAMAREDLGVEPGEPVSYHAVVFEVPLPALHWYRWPNSRSRLLSNGCHWLDHFLYLNEFAAVSDMQLAAAPDGSLNASVTLENGAFFTMALTDRGSRRLGVRDHVELRANGATVTIEDQSRYQAENGSRVLRRRRIPRLDAYRLMYDEIGRRIAAGEPGESAISVRRSANLVLDLEERLERLQNPVRERAPQRVAPRPQIAVSA